MSASIRLQKAWRDLSEAEVARLPAQLGVYELGDADGGIAYVGFAGGNSQFGLRGEIGRWLGDEAAAVAFFRYEVTMQYTSRYKELLMVFDADHGAYPRLNAQSMPNLGRLRLA